MLRKIVNIAVLLSALLLTGCVAQPHFIVKVDSLARPDADIKKTYIILPGAEGLAAGDLQFQEFAGYVDKVLLSRGLYKARNIGEADLAIFLSYGIGEPQTHHYSYSLPVFGQTGVSSSTTYGTVSSYGNSANYSATTSYTPSYGIVGSSSHEGAYVDYRRFLELDAYDVAASRERKDLVSVWKTSISSTGSNSDLRLVMPYLVYAMKPYVGTNTEHAITVDLLQGNAAVAQFFR